MRQEIDARRWPDTIVAVYLSRRAVTSRIASQRRQQTTGNYGAAAAGPLHAAQGPLIRAGTRRGVDVRGARR